METVVTSSQALTKDELGFQAAAVSQQLKKVITKSGISRKLI